MSVTRLAYNARLTQGSAAGCWTVGSNGKARNLHGLPLPASVSGGLRACGDGPVGKVLALQV